MKKSKLWHTRVVCAQLLFRCEFLIGFMNNYYCLKLLYTQYWNYKTGICNLDYIYNAYAVHWSTSVKIKLLIYYFRNYYRRSYRQSSWRFKMGLEQIARIDKPFKRQIVSGVNSIPAATAPPKLVGKTFYHFKYVGSFTS